MPTTQSFGRFEKRLSVNWLLLIAVSTTVLFILDLQTVIGVATWMLYLAPLAATFFVSRPIAPLVMAALSTLLIIADYVYSPEGIAAWISQVNRGIGLAVIWMVAILLRRIIIDRLALKEREWLMTAQTKLADQVIGEQSILDLSSRIVNFVADYLGAKVGAVYLVEADGSLSRTAGFAVPADHAPRIAAGQGLLGQSLVAREIQHLRALPASYLLVNSALGSAPSAEVLVLPLFADHAPIGAIELGFLNSTYAVDKVLLDVLADSIAIALRTAKLRAEREQLLRETQRQAEELQAQQEELRVANEELEQQSTMLKESQARLETQQAELEQTNVQLEEHTQLLARQNDDLEGARSELVAKAAELERSNQFKSEFLANMSHELRTPLNSSLILAKLLGDNASGNLTEEQVKFARNIYSAGNDLLELINDILDLSKIEARKVDVVRERINVQQLIDTVEQTFQPISKEKRLAFEIVVEDDAPAMMESDSQRIRQVLKNLLSNALKFTQQGGVRLRVFGIGDGDKIGFDVIDSGIGIAPEQHEIIFQPFRQADGTTNRRFGGTGLGLSISRELANLLGGTIELKSIAGVGSTFTFVVPRVLPERDAEAAEQPRFNPPTVRPSRPKRKVQQQPAARIQKQGSVGSDRLLLIIEDDAQFASTLCDLTGSLGYECINATTADEGIELALRHRPTAIMLDIHLPDHTGLTVLDRLKHNPATRHIPVQVISGFDYTQAALEMGAANVMLKPVDRDRLVDALTKLEQKSADGERAVLIVEDNAIQRDSIRELLKAEGVRAVAVESAAQALEQLRGSTFDCMVLDLALPDASGFELLERMATDDAYSFPPVIVYTARVITQAEEQQLRKYSKSIIIKGAKSPERLLDEVTLFLHKVEESLPAEQQRLLRLARSREAMLEGKNILLVEDDVRNVFAITRILEPHGAKLQVARNGVEALEALKQSPQTELVLMDIMMPEMDGLQATREIRKQTTFKNLPIIALTAKAMPDDRQRCLDAGANDYITKPIDVEKLLSLVRIWLSSRRGMLA